MENRAVDVGVDSEAVPQVTSGRVRGSIVD